MTTPLRALVDDAIQKINTYRRPNVDDAVKALREVLQAMGTGAPSEHDGIESMTEDGDGLLRIVTAYSVRCCAMSDEFEIPASIIDAPDPIAAAKLWGWKRKVDIARADLSAAEHNVVHARARLKEALMAEPAMTK